MRQFSVGEVVTFIPDWILRSAAPGDYKIVSSMPDRDGDHMYRVKSPLEEHERVVRENLLVKSDGCLPDEFVRQRSHRRSITLPSLKQLEVRLHLEPITSMPSLSSVRIKTRPRFFRAEMTAKTAEVSAQ